MPTKKLEQMCMQICDAYNMDINVHIQPNHRYDLNAPDAGIHNVLKGGIRNRRRAKTVEHLKRDIRVAAADMLHHRTVQNAFKKAYSRDKNGDVDETLIPSEIMAWYDRQ